MNTFQNSNEPSIKETVTWLQNEFTHRRAGISNQDKYHNRGIFNPFTIKLNNNDPVLEMTSHNFNEDLSIYGAKSYSKIITIKHIRDMQVTSYNNMGFYLVIICPQAI